jgi:hypothetical protein
MTVIEHHAEPKAAKPKKAKAAPQAPSQAVAVHTPHPAPAPVNPVSIVERAIEKGITGADLKEIMDLQERWEANQARKAFDVAMANAQAEMPLIVKNRLVDYETSKKDAAGNILRTTYKHEDLAVVVETIRPVLHKHGLAHRFRTEHLENGQIRVTCIITGHGHREETSLQSSRDGTGSKNDIQAIASTVTYLERYTLKASLGLAAAHDDDGNGSEPPAVITAAQLKILEDLIKEVKADEPRLLTYAKVEKLSELPVGKFDDVKSRLEAKRAPL